MCILDLESLNSALEQIEESLQSAVQIEDSKVVIRIVGEFSSGKSRLLTEWLGEVLPAALRPISSQDRQTLLPLEVCFGPRPTLTLRSAFGDRTYAELARFPGREEVAALLAKNRLRERDAVLRLEVPENNLLFGDDPGKRYFLVDTPGWNSDDEDRSEEYTKPSIDQPILLYVASADHLESQASLNHLIEIADELDSMASAFDAREVIIYVTKSNRDERKAERFESFRAHLRRVFEDELFDLQVGTPIPIEFGRPDRQSIEDTAEIEQMRTHLWNKIQEVLQNSPYSRPSEPKIGDGIRDALARLSMLVDLSRQTLDVVASTSDVFPGENATRLKYADPVRREARLRAALNKSVPSLEPLIALGMEEWTEDTASAWMWRLMLQPSVRQIITAKDKVSKTLKSKIAAIAKADLSENRMDFNDEVKRELELPLQELESVIGNLEVLFTPALRAAIADPEVTELHLFATTIAVVTGISFVSATHAQ